MKYSKLETTSLIDYLQQFEQLIENDVKYSNKEYGGTIFYSLQDKDKLKQYFIECYYKKEINLNVLTYLCKNIFKVQQTSYNYNRDIELDKFTARVQIYRFCNNFFNKK